MLGRCALSIGPKIGLVLNMLVLFSTTWRRYPGRNGGVYWRPRVSKRLPNRPSENSYFDCVYRYFYAAIWGNFSAKIRPTKPFFGALETLREVSETGRFRGLHKLQRVRRLILVD